jgi:hypothetical protein
LYQNAIDWPPHATLVASGSLPSGQSYCVLAFDRNPPSPGPNALPPIPYVLMAMLDPHQGVAQREPQGIVVPATGREKPIWAGPFINLPSGKYTVAFRIETGADPATPLCALKVTDGFGKREYVSRSYSTGDLAPANGSGYKWASIDFSVPEGSPTRVMEFIMSTTGKAPFVVNGMKLDRHE